jgi:hypothetical protein
LFTALEMGFEWLWVVGVALTALVWNSIQVGPGVGREIAGVMGLVFFG